MLTTVTLAWGYCILKIVWGMYVDVLLNDNMLLAMSSGHSAANGGAITTYFKASVCQSKLDHIYVRPDTCHIVMKKPTHVLNMAPERTVQRISTFTHPPINHHRGNRSYIVWHKNG